jgi:hypothetical protein
MRSTTMADDDIDDMKPLGWVLAERDAERLRRLATSLLRAAGASERACPRCGLLVREPDVVVDDEDTGRPVRKRARIDADTLAPHKATCDAAVERLR